MTRKEPPTQSKKPWWERGPAIIAAILAGLALVLSQIPGVSKAAREAVDSICLHWQVVCIEDEGREAESSAPSSQEGSEEVSRDEEVSPPEIAEVDAGTVLAAIRTSVTPSGSKSSQGHDNFDVLLWLDLSLDEASQIRSVRYWINHPSFDNPRIPINFTNYSVQWTGWGCVRSAHVVVERIDGEILRVPFDLCEAMKRGRL